MAFIELEMRDNGNTMTHEFGVGDHKVNLEIALGEPIDVSKTHETDGLRGSPKFDAVAHFGAYFKDHQLAGSELSDEQQWLSWDNLPPGVEVLEFSPKHGQIVKRAAEGIEELANFGSFFDPGDIAKYATYDSQIAEWQKPREKKVIPLAIVRAGIPALLVAGYRPEEMVMVEEKRLRPKIDHEQIGVGLRYDEKQLKGLAGQTVYIRERAQATFASLMALDLLMAAKNCLPAKTYWAATVASQQGIELALKHVDRMKAEFGKETVISVGRVGSILTAGDHPYYIARRNGKGELIYLVGDGGDWGDLLIPAQYRALWKGYFSQAEKKALNTLSAGLGDLVSEGEEISLESVGRLYREARKQKGVGLAAIEQLLINGEGK